MNKETYQQSKLAAFESNIKAYSHDLSKNPDTLCEHVGITYLDKQEAYREKDFSNSERLVEILNRQSTIRGTQHIFHRLNLIRNG